LRTLFARFLLWFWIGLAVLLGAEILLETHSLNEGLAVHFGHVARPIELYADLARAVFVTRGEPGLDSLRRTLDREADIETFVFDSTAAARDKSSAAANTAVAALRAGRSIVVEKPEGFFIGSPLVRRDGRLDAFVLHPRHGPERRGLLPPDLAERALAMLVLGGIGCWLLARYIAAPVSRLRQATQRIAAGDLTARVGARQQGRRDEIEDLGRDFDQMAERLETLVGAQRRLLSDISHELRSPLARMNVALALMRQRIADDPDGMMARLELEARGSTS
jgi:two-component system sensor histidine kinase CpxA